MTIFHAVQIAVSLAVVAHVILRCRALFYARALDGAAFRSALLRLLRAQRIEDARALANAARPAHAAEVVWPMLDPEVPNDERHVEAHDAIGIAESDATKGLRALRVAASVASALGFIGAAIEIRWVFAGEHGLLGLQAGLVENIGLSRAVISIALGVATSSFALGSWGVLRGGARTLIGDCRRALDGVEEVLEKR